MKTKQVTAGMKEITIDLSTEQYNLVHRIAQLQDIEPSELIMGYIRIGLDADTEAPVQCCSLSVSGFANHNRGLGGFFP